MTKYLIDKTGIHEIHKNKSTKRHLRRLKYMGKSELRYNGEAVKVYGNNR